jgi:hypothetical protein
MWGPDPQDVCIVTWLEGQTNLQACANARFIPTFGFRGSSGV